jgi:hypothetical protein
MPVLRPLQSWPNLSQHKVIPPGLGHIVQGRTVSIHCLVAAQGQDTSVRDDLSQGIKINGDWWSQYECSGIPRSGTIHHSIMPIHHVIIHIYMLIFHCWTMQKYDWINSRLLYFCRERKRKIQNFLSARIFSYCYIKKPQWRSQRVYCRLWYIIHTQKNNALFYLFQKIHYHFYLKFTLQQPRTL